ncbi:hypothetical protein CHS0354_034508 [Potamilus streckersoni]|uniref:DBB domain-containing protein n=1 Tax=Potamilus streckersoni TaxID=2493646 RepID=A0AAE0SGG5_9BIVA|nr:hypothetical protein CHS0354_034508 [Potamilus streckersoni]
MTNEEKIHRIFTDEEGRDFAERIKNSFDRGCYRVQFKLHDVKSTNNTDIYESGVSILLLKPRLLNAIKAGSHPNLDTLFQNPKFSIVICLYMDKNKSQVSKILSDKVNGFLHWTYINFCSHDDFTDLKLNILSLVEKSEGVEDVPTTPRLQNFKLWPGEDCKPKQSILLLFERPVDDHETVMVIVNQEGGKLSLATQRLNSMTFSFSVGDMVAGMKTIEVFVNKSSYGRVKLHVESKMVELEHLLHDVTNATELLSQSLCCENRNDLDKELRKLLSNCPISSLNSLFSKLEWDTFGETTSKNELPTLLHFGAKFGLLNFCQQLIALPGGRQAMKIRNKNNLLPHEIAQQNGFLSLASQLEEEHDGIYRSVVSLVQCPKAMEQRSTPRAAHTFGDRFGSSSNSYKNDFVPYAIKQDKYATSSESGISSQSRSSPRRSQDFTDRMTKMLDDEKLDSTHDSWHPSQFDSQCMESILHMEITKL